MNVWVEQGDVLFYAARSGAFDENNTLLKAGRFRLSLSPGLNMEHFRQTLHLEEGYVEISDGQLSIQLWADVWKPVVHVDVSSPRIKQSMAVTYENWRTKEIELTKRESFQTSYKFAAPKGLTTHADSVVATNEGVIFMHQNSAETVFDATVSQQGMDTVKDRLYNPLKNRISGGRMLVKDMILMDQISGRYASSDYEGWLYVTKFPKRTFHLQVVMATVQGTPDAHSQWPTKFNGGLFTFDPEYVNSAEEYHLSPDFRNWGGGVHTAQNQRLVYWPMLKNGDFDLLKAQLDFYLRIYKNAEERSRLYWGHEGACLTEQIENYGLPCYPEYGTKRPAGFDPGMERNAWLEYEWDTCLEFCMMALEAQRYGGMVIKDYLPMIRSCLRFFDEHYQYLANQRGAKRFDGNGKLVLYPGSGGETFKGAYNSTSTIAALRTVAEALIDMRYETEEMKAFLSRLPDITIRDGMIAPALHYERVQNVETTQLYPVFPWRMYGVGRPNLDVARRTYENDTLAVKFRSHVGWKQDAIWAACLGMTDEAQRLVTLKMHDGPYRFPAWPKEWDVRFKLHASCGTVVEAELRQGKVTNVRVTPTRNKDNIIVCIK